MLKKLKIEGMSCQHCVNSVRSAIENIEGVEVHDVNIGHATIETVLKGPEQFLALEEKMISAINAAGYKINRIE